MAGGAKTSGPKMDEDYQAEDDHRTLQRAADVMADPDRMQRVTNRHAKMSAALTSMASTIGKGIKKPRSKRQIAKLAILRRQRTGR